MTRSIGKSLYTLFQVMTLESWSMGISRPVMDVFPWAWVYFVPFVLISSFVIMNVVVGIVVNSISEVQMELSKEKAERKNEKSAKKEGLEISESSENADKTEQIKEQLSALKEQISELEKLL
ncbi:MAG: ion transporter [Lachnospiraceae bacterium]|nr:ion transporter [Lachnospiraceae bacterium]MBR1649559.1 ion transporter [Lachnospiraceae bacterium]